MLHALALAIGDLRDGRVLAVLARSLLVSVAIFVGLGALLVWLLRGADPCAAIGLDGCVLGGAASGVGALALTLLALWFLFPAVALGVVANYADAIVGAVEARAYPAAAATARRLGMAGSAWFGMRQSLRVLLYNLIALPLYLVLIVTGIGPLILFMIVNALAIAADLGAMVAIRHDDGAGGRAWLRRSRGDRVGIGLATAALLLVPFLNLLAPVIGAAAMAHLYHGRRDRPRTLAR